MSTSTTSPYAVGQDPRLEKILERAKKIEEWIKYLESKAVHLQSVDRARSDDYFEEFEVAIELLLKDLVLDLWNAKGWTSDKLSWSWSPPDYEADHRDFLGRLYCTLKLAEQIHEENSRLENFPIKLSPPPLEQLSSQDNKPPETFCSDTETSLTRLPRQLQQDDRHQNTTVRISEDLTEFSEVFKYYHSRLKKYVQEIRGHQGIQQELLNNTSPTSSHPITLPYPLSSSPPGELGRRESCLMRGKYSSLPRQDQAALNAEPGKEGSKRKRSEAVENFEEGLKGQKVVYFLKLQVLTFSRAF